jgi:uncharacterized OB-fold protein
VTTRPLPVPNELTEAFWKYARNGQLALQRCSSCGYYYHPPEPYCIRCLSRKLEFSPVSGKGHLRSYTEVWAGARHDYFKAAIPYIVAGVELEEQPELVVYANITDATVSSLAIGMPLEVHFEQLNDEIAIPQFRPAKNSFAPDKEA